MKRSLFIAGAAALASGAAVAQPLPCGEPYAIQRGDTLQRLAERAYGPEGAFETLYEANRERLGWWNPSLIEVGDEIVIPCPEPGSEAAATAEAGTGAEPPAPLVGAEPPPTGAAEAEASEASESTAREASTDGARGGEPAKGARLEPAAAPAPQGMASEGASRRRGAEGAPQAGATETPPREAAPAPAPPPEPATDAAAASPSSGPGERVERPGEASAEAPPSQPGGPAATPTDPAPSAPRSAEAETAAPPSQPGTAATADAPPPEGPLVAVLQPPGPVGPRQAAALEALARAAFEAAGGPAPDIRRAPQLGARPAALAAEGYVLSLPWVAPPCAAAGVEDPLGLCREIRFSAPLGEVAVGVFKRPGERVDTPALCVDESIAATPLTGAPLEAALRVEADLEACLAALLDRQISHVAGPAEVAEALLRARGGEVEELHALARVALLRAAAPAGDPAAAAAMRRLEAGLAALRREGRLFTVLDAARAEAEGGG